jgi:hypothetical protein
MYSEASGHSELARQIYCERSKDTSQCTNLCKRCAASSRFGVFRNEQARSWPATEDRILVAEENTPHKIQELHFQQSF